MNVILNNNITQILTYYTAVKNKIKNITNVPVSNIHSYQGCESDNVLILHYSPQSLKGQVYKKENMISALTRGLHSVVLYTIAEIKYDKISQALLMGNHDHENFLQLIRGAETS